MVVPYEIGDPVRSFVLVPGTGFDKKAKSVCLDLARSSSVAGAVPVQSTVHPMSVTSLVSNKPNKKEESQDVRSQQGQNRDTGQDEGARPQPASHNQGSADQHAQGSVSGSRKRSLDADSQENGCTPQTTKALKTESDKGSNENGGNTDETESSEVAELRRKCEELQKQNANLSRRLALFHDLFKNKERLRGFVNYLERST